MLLALGAVLALALQSSLNALANDGVEFVLVVAMRAATGGGSTRSK